MTLRLAVAVAAALIGTLVGCARRDVIGTPGTPGIVLDQDSWSAGGRNGVAIRTLHVRLFTNLPPGQLRDRLPMVIEYTLAGVSRFWANHPPPESELEVVVYSTLVEWRRAVVRRFGVEPGEGLDHGAATSRGISLLHDIGSEETLRLTAHEVWHAYAQRSTQSALPTAIDEAIACYVEGMRWDAGAAGPILSAVSNPGRRRHVAALAQANRLGTLGEHLAVDPYELTDAGGDLDEYYARAWNLGLVLLDSGDAKLKRGVERLLEDARRGTPAYDVRSRGAGLLEQLCDNYFGCSPEEMETLWQQSARRWVRP